MSDSDKQQNNLDALLDGFSMSTSWAKTSPDQHLSDISKFAEKQAPLGERNDKRNRSEKRPRGDKPAFQKHDNFSKQNTNGDASRRSHLHGTCQMKNGLRMLPGLMTCHFV
jgi:hypothetical protein